MTSRNCQNCGKTIGPRDEPVSYLGRLICTDCNIRLQRQLQALTNADGDTPTDLQRAKSPLDRNGDVESLNFNYKTQHLVSMAQSGDESALNRLCSVYGERVRRIVRLRMGKELRSKMESMDLVQDAFISALRSMENFTYKNEGDFLRWLAQIAENRLRDHVEKLHTNKRDIRREIPLDNNRQSQDSFVRTPGPMALTTPSMILSKREELDRLEKAVDKLKPEYKEVIILTKIEGLSHKEVADRLGKNPHAVCMLLSRALTALAEVYEDI